MNLKKIAWVVLALFLLGNIIIYNQAYHFTHFVESDEQGRKKPEELNTFEKIRTLFFGIKIPKPKNDSQPKRQYETIKLKSYEDLEAWHIKIPNSKGTVLLFHGYSGSKSGLLRYSEAFNQKGYSTFLLDFMGSGGSGGNTTTIGFKESRDVMEAYQYVLAQNASQNIILFGCSMGAVAIMKAVADYKIKPHKIILECPFGSFKKTTDQRFKAMKIPSFPLSNLLLLHGSLQLGFNTFKHNPTEYAKTVNTPTLLLSGAKDARVTREEINTIYENLKGEKILGIMKQSGHEIYLNNDGDKWHKMIDKFLDSK